MTDKSSGHRPKKSHSPARGRDAEKKPKLFSAKPEPEQARTLAQKFLNFFGFGKPPVKTAPQKNKKGKKSVEKHPVTGERLFIGNLSYSVKEEDLTELFGDVGTVQSAEIARNRQTRRSKGFGFVTMGSIAEAEKAVADLDGTSLSGREISVSGAKNESRKTGPGKEREPRSPRSTREPRKREGREDRREGREDRREGRDRSRRKEGGKPKKGSQSTVVPMSIAEVTSPLLVLNNLSEDFGRSELDHLFAGVAKISEANISDGKAEIEMESVEDAQTAVRLLDGKDFMGQTLSLSSQAE
ncbi:MAG: RNA-binding protein [Verrucomicrobiales bacterium]|nr:RNA-binding protein [Verrucomicrobiales bacterium]